MRTETRPLALGYERRVVVECDRPVAMRLDAERWALVSPCPTEPGRWRVTWFDAIGASGHTTRATAVECAQVALDDGYEPTEEPCE